MNQRQLKYFKKVSEWVVTNENFLISDSTYRYIGRCENDI